MTHYYRLRSTSVSSTSSSSSDSSDSSESSDESSISTSTPAVTRTSNTLSPTSLSATAPTPAVASSSATFHPNPERPTIARKVPASTCYQQTPDQADRPTVARKAPASTYYQQTPDQGQSPIVHDRPSVARKVPASAYYQQTPDPTQSPVVSSASDSSSDSESESESDSDSPPPPKSGIKLHFSKTHILKVRFDHTPDIHAFPRAYELHQAYERNALEMLEEESQMPPPPPPPKSGIKFHLTKKHILKVRFDHTPDRHAFPRAHELHQEYERDDLEMVDEEERMRQFEEATRLYKLEVASRPVQPSKRAMSKPGTTMKSTGRTRDLVVRDRTGAGVRKAGMAKVKKEVAWATGGTMARVLAV
ncbi:hypothetical protein BJ508DRAFT_412337 [Ascobolus immersus RN42]|uniref:Uncharacterized protein n=1 Tax=Ascobolus immersus RN42 TaxID=1160509 RepID=A0A3N4ITF7_ASCIM|nr:hypothetical protein BJ508DRAFT_412337 [Ascobolus immersus RN42]